jgi:hypothetical protein
MKAKFLSRVVIATVGATVIATLPATAQQRTMAPAEQVTLTGCVMKESDWRKAQRFAVPLGDGDEYILANATVAESSRSASPAATAGPTNGAVGTTGRPLTSYELIGKNEKMAAPYVGKHVEMSGTLKAQEIGPSGPTGGPSAPVTADLRMRELDVASVHEAEGTCNPNGY